VYLSPFTLTSLWSVSLERLLQLLAAGGPIMYLLVGLSVLVVAVVLMKCAQFTYLGLGVRAFLDEALAAWQQGDDERALELLAARRHPVALLMRQAMQGMAAGGADRQALEEHLACDAARAVAGLRSYLRLLELLATLSPLLGLLGTVLGMIEAFQALEAAGARVNPAILSGGIWVALLTTAAGLIVAIPAAAAHNLFEGVVERTTAAMEDAATRILAGRPRPPAAQGAAAELPPAAVGA